MAIQVGEKIPSAEFFVLGEDGPGKVTSDEIFNGKNVVLFAVPGAFTPTCHEQHMPGFVKRLDDLKSKGYDTIACTAVNDIFVLDHWAKSTGAAGRVVMLGDGNADFAKKVGLDIDLTDFGLGVRSKRYAMVIHDGVVKVLNVEDSPPEHAASSADAVCSAVEAGL